MYQKVLIPLDGSEVATQAIPHAQELATRYNAQLILFRVVKPITLTNPSLSSYRLIEEAGEFAFERAKEYMEELGNKIRDNDGLEVKTEVKRGTPAKEILEYVDENNIDLIVMTARGQSGLTEWLLGSVANKVIRGSHIPILLVRAI